MTTKEYLIKTSYDDAGLAKMKDDFQNATNAANSMGANISNSATLVSQSVSQSFNRMGEQVRTVTSVINDQGKLTKVVFRDMGDTIQAVSQNAQTFGTVAGTLSGELEKVVGRALLVAPAWLALRFAMTSLIQVFQESISFMIEWETQMARIRVVTGASQSEIDALSGSIMHLAEDLGISNKDVAEAANQWLRMGATISDVIPRLEATAKLSKISGESMSESANRVNTIMSAFQLDAGQASSAIDKLIGIEEKSGVSLEVLTSAFEKAGVKAKQAGVSFDQFAGYVAAVNEKTRQSGELIGTQLVNLFNRLGTSAVLNAQAISGVPFYLDKAGQATTVVTERFRPLNTIISELSKSWKNLTDAQQDALAKQLGGAKQVNTVIALLSNFDEAIKASGTSAAESQKALSELADTTESKVTRLKDTWGEFVQTVSATGIVKTFLDQVTIRVYLMTAAIQNLQSKWDNLFNPSKIKAQDKVLTDFAFGLNQFSQPRTAIQGKNDDKNKENIANLTTLDIQNKIKDLEVQAVLTRQEKLVTVQKELDLIAQGDGQAQKDLKNQRESLLAHKANLEVAQELLRLNENQNVIETQLKAQGASQLQIDIAHLAYLKEIHASQEEISKQQSKVDISGITQYKSIQDDIVNALFDERKAVGETNLMQIEHKIALQEQLGVHLQGIDLLKQQLELYKAISDEVKKTPLDRLKEAADLIKKTPIQLTAFERQAQQFQVQAQESRLVEEGRRRGISRETIEGILNPNTGKGAGGRNSLQGELKNALTDPLNISIGSLKQSIEQLAYAITNSYRSPNLQSNLSFNNPEGTITTAQGFKSVGSAERLGASVHPVTVEIAGINVTVKGNSREEIAKHVSELVHEQTLAQLNKPGSKHNNSVKQIVENY